ncbi:MAG TPA: argininosuccinate synthase [Armatimonadota bacterium]|nr:argininosuccinate synthase [Armatimonadota bacterium]
MAETVVLAYSGGLDTSVIIRWLQVEKGMDVVAVAIDVGEERDYAGIRQKALAIGAKAAYVIDAKERFADEYIAHAIKANAMYEGRYPVSTALARPLIAQLVGEIAEREGAGVLCHGSTGKGNDQVRFEVTWQCLFPQMRIYAPVREWGMTRDEEIAYAERHNVPVPVTKTSPYSLDVNLWGKSCEAGVLEDPWAEPPADVWTWTTSPLDAPDEPGYVTIGFDAGVPVSLDGQAMGLKDIIVRLNGFAGAHGVGRIDMIENRLVGIKSRETYECPAAVTLLAAHRELETLCLERAVAHFKAGIEQKYTELIYNGLWFSPLRLALDAFIDETQRLVTGEVRMKLHKGACMAAGRRSPHSLYRFELATYDTGDQFDQGLAKGFIDLWGLPAKVWNAANREE